MPFDHEQLIVYQRAIELVAWVDTFIETAGLKGEIKSQLDRASMSVPLNIAEGNGRFSIPDRIRFLEIAYGSSLECAACLDVARAKRISVNGQIAEGKALLEEIVNRLIRLRQSLETRNDRGGNSPRVREEAEVDWFSLCELERLY